MSSITEKLTKKGLIKPPKWLPSNVFYETIMGSDAYGVSSGASDTDIYGWCIPPKEMVFFHLSGEIFGFGKQIQRFEQYQQHHIDTKDGSDKIYDIQIYNIVKYFQLCTDCNPNMIDSLFTPDRCVVHITRIGQMVRDQRKIFLHKGSWHKFKGYAYSEMHKIRSKSPPEGKRKELVDKFGYDVKFAYHVVRLINEAEMILTEGDIDLERNREQLKSIRNGEWGLEDIERYFSDKERDLEKVYIDCKVVPIYPNEEKIKTLLLNCLEDHYGTLANCIEIQNKHQQFCSELKTLQEKYGV